MTDCKRIVKITGIVLAAVLAVLIIAFISIMLYLDSIMPETVTPLGEYVSNDGKHVVTAYQSDSILINPTYTIASVRGTWIIGQRTIYSVDHAEDVVVVWIDNHTVNVNGAILNIYFDRYREHAKDSEKNE